MLFYATFSAQRCLDPYRSLDGAKRYHSGASLYFTFAFKANPDATSSNYDTVKKAAEDTFMQNGAAVSHHHAIGYEHRPWLEDDITTVGIEAIKGIKMTLDPLNIMNPGNPVGSHSPLTRP